MNKANVRQKVATAWTAARTSLPLVLPFAFLRVRFGTASGWPR